MALKKISISVVLLVLTLCNIQAQQHLDPEYIKVTNERASKIVEKLELSDSEKVAEVTSIIAKQYQNLSKIHDERDEKIKALKKSSLSKEKEGCKTDKLKYKADKSISKLHKLYVKQLESQLNAKQVEGVKDGMTYGVLPKTYAAFLDMIPSLNKEEKEYIYNNLKEAREHAIDGGSSKEKHAWFGKYKGRINNYLSARGYDLEKERDGWYERIEECKKVESNQ
jgi:hypothetical protein